MTDDNIETAKEYIVAKARWLYSKEEADAEESRLGFRAVVCSDTSHLYPKSQNSNHEEVRFNNFLKKIDNMTSPKRRAFWALVKKIQQGKIQ